MLPPPYISYGSEPFTDSPPSPPSPWHELQQIAERAGVSVEYLCTAVEIAALSGNENKFIDHVSSTWTHQGDLEGVVRTLADEGFSTKAGDPVPHGRHEWQESEHPRDENGRFANGNAHPAREEGEESGSPLPLVSHTQALKELHGVHTALGQMFPRLTPRWRGELEIKPKIELGSAGTKSWLCMISIAQEQFAVPARKFCSMVHESLHSYSPTSLEEMPLAPNWEEGAIENSVRVHRAQIAKQSGVSISEQEFRERDKVHPYRYYARAIERMRVALGNTNKADFYDHLLHLPAHKIEPYILSQAALLDPESRARFNRIYAFEKKILDGEWDRKKGTYSAKWLKEEKKMNETKAVNREDVLCAILYARGRKAVAQAQKMRDEWVKLHPDDDEIFEASEVLEMLAEGYALRPDLEHPHEQ